MFNSRLSRGNCIRTLVMFSMIFSCILSAGIVSSRMSDPAVTATFMQVNPRLATMPGSSDPTGDEWPMFHGALNHTGVASTTPVEGTGPTWSFKTGAPMYASPAVVGGRVYACSSDGKIYCLNSSTGELVWSYSTTSMSGIPSSPAIADGRVYIGSLDNKTYCFNAFTGALIWSFTTGKEIRDSSPAISGGRVYIGSWDRNTYCLNATTGSRIWNYTFGHPIDASPAISRGRLYIGDIYNETCCLNASTGKLIWSFNEGCEPGTSPMITSNDRAYIPSGNGSICCLNASTGKSSWSYPFFLGVSTTPTTANGMVYIEEVWDNRTYFLNATTGVEAWYIISTPAGTTSPAISSGRLYAGCYNGKLYCFNDTTGRQLWNYTIGKAFVSSPAIAKGHVFVGTDNDSVCCFPMILTTATVPSPNSDTPFDSTTFSIILLVGVVGLVGWSLKKMRPGLYKGFHKDASNDDKDSAKAFQKIQKLVDDCYEECRRLPDAQKPGKMIILGLQAVGKTSIINQLTMEKFDPKIKPTLGMQIIKSVIDNFKFQIYDLGGQEKIRKTWYDKTINPDAVIFVLDVSAGKDQQDLAKEEFNRMCDNFFSKDSGKKLADGTPLLILGNKCDLNESFTVKKVEALLKPSKNLNYKIGLYSALKNEGLEENFKWLVKSFLFV
ncbi:MAG TPA: PQQ-binding-like beta-propeller repeat protein [Candidatus Lokiarchaeia archaeon]|nr:PQQ-binding-like beta-propeller repeat protein [Candidatus Lokiarchaeia archaeon]